jgi:uncharacterized protein
MRIAVLSDIHDNIWKLDEALKRLEGTHALICCGDLCSPFIVPQLAQGFKKPIHIVFGNNDGDLFRITQEAMKFDHVTLHGAFAELEFAAKRVAVNHYPEIARALAASGKYDVVCFGHNHEFEIAREGKTLLINPGEIMGRFGRSTLVVYDSEKHEAEGLEL